MARAYPTVLDLVGNTPIVRLPRLSQEVPATLLAKLEYMNPGGSNKDRIGLAMIEAAERDGKLKPGGTIVEPTSGNTGVGLAIAAAQKGYRCIFVMPDKMSQEKISMLRGYGAEVVITPTAVDHDSPESYYSVSSRLAEEIPGGFKPDQYSNMSNPEAHYLTTGPEILEQTGGEVDALVISVGTGGTISGVGRYFKEHAPHVKIVGVDPEGSVYTAKSDADLHPYLVEGIGKDTWPETMDPKVVDEWIRVSDRDSFLAARRMAREEGLLVGGSCGMAVVAALEVAQRGGPDDVIVVLLPDGGRGYLSTVFNDQWMASYGFMQSDTTEFTVGDVLRGKDGSIPDLVHGHPNETVSDIVAIMREFSVSQMPIVKAEPPVMMAEVRGAVTERDLLDRLFTGKASLTDRVEDHLAPPLPTVGITEPLSQAMTSLQGGDGLLIISDGRPAGIVSRADVLAFLAGR
jgi:cystathionine beta-synthase